MKIKHTHLLPAITLAALTPVMAQSTGVDKSAANYKEGKFSDYLEIAEKAMAANADDLPEELTSRDLFSALGFENIKSYAQSSTPKEPSGSIKSDSTMVVKTKVRSNCYWIPSTRAFQYRQWHQPALTSHFSLASTSPALNLSSRES